MDQTLSSGRRHTAIAVLIPIGLFCLALGMAWFYFDDKNNSKQRNVAFRLAEVQRQQSLFMKTEGYKKRAKNFEKLTVQLEMYRQAGGLVTNQEVLKYLGPPDLTYTDPVGGEMFTYFFDKDTTKDWTCDVWFYPASSQLVRQLGWNAANANDHSFMQKFNPATKPAASPSSGTAGN